MKLMIFTFIVLVLGDRIFAQTSAPTTLTTAAVQVATPVATPAAVVPTPKAQPPEWVVNALTALESLPTVGPIISKVVQYLAILGSLMTLLAGFVMGMIKLVGPLVAVGEGDSAAAKVQSWMDSSLVYWLKYISFFNAQKTAEKPKV
jgi:hypothetical protein